MQKSAAVQYKGTLDDDIYVQAVMGLIPTCWIGSCSCRLLRSFFFISTFQEMHIFATSPSLMTNFATSATELGKITNPISGVAQGKYFITRKSYFLGGGRHKNKLHFKGIIKLSKVPSYQSSPISKYTRIFCCRGKDGYSNQLFEYKT